MMDPKVKVVAGNRGKFVLRWVDQYGSARQRSTDLESRPSNRKHAYRLASELEAELAGDAPPNLMVSRRKKATEVLPGSGQPTETSDQGSWAEYREHFETTHLAGLSKSYRSTLPSILNVFERFARPQRLQDVTASLIRRWLAELREKGHPPSTIQSYWRHLSAFLGMAVDDGLIESIPRIRLKNVGRKMKGRPLLAEEIDRIKMAIEELRPESQWESWKWTIDGLVASGLRISEAYRLTWHPSDFQVAQDSGYFEYLIRNQKNGRQQKLVVVPGFARLLQAVPKNRRHGFVFPFPGRSGRVSFSQAKTVLRELGAKAKVKTGDGSTASAHDFRRTFATHLANNRDVTPQMLQAIMRHADIATTMTFYAEVNAEEVLNTLNGVGDQKGDQAKRIAKEQGQPKQR